MAAENITACIPEGVTKKMLEKYGCDKIYGRGSCRAIERIL
ncbi:MAG: hypothetical protein R2942_02605 [Ignavibacteria bacterium]